MAKFWGSYSPLHVGGLHFPTIRVCRVRGRNDYIRPVFLLSLNNIFPGIPLNGARGMVMKF